MYNVNIWSSVGGPPVTLEGFCRSQKPSAVKAECEEKRSLQTPIWAALWISFNKSFIKILKVYNVVCYNYILIISLLYSLYILYVIYLRLRLTFESFFAPGPAPHVQARLRCAPRCAQRCAQRCQGRLQRHLPGPHGRRETGRSWRKWKVNQSETMVLIS